MKQPMKIEDWSATCAPTLEEFEAIADEAYQALPKVLRSRVDTVVVRVEEFADDDTLEEMGCESPFDLMGLYRGISLDRKSVSDVVQDVDMIFLYRRPLLDFWCESGDTLGVVIRHVLIHEIGHHFGYSDDDMEMLDAQP
jgi:predicted Zn-dependent protease with MMP-like domain